MVEFLIFCCDITKVNSEYLARHENNRPSSEAVFIFCLTRSSSHEQHRWAHVTRLLELRITDLSVLTKRSNVLTKVKFQNGCTLKTDAADSSKRLAII